MLIKIRTETIGSSAVFNFKCNFCNEKFEIEEDINNIINLTYKDYGILKTDNVTLKMGPIKNKQTFNEYLIDAKTPREIYLIEFLMQIEEINGEDVFTIEYLNDLFSLIKFSDIFLNSRFKNDFLILGFFSFSSNLSITVCFKFKILIT